MLSYFKGPGGFWQRLASEAVPIWAAALTFGVWMPFVALPVAILMTVLMWVGVSALLRRVRKHDRLRRVYRLALGLHIAFWSGLGVMHSHMQEAGPVGTPTVHDWGAFADVRVGYGASRFELLERTTLAGWGQTPRRIRIAPFGGLGVLGRIGQGFMGGTTEKGEPRFPLFRTADNVFEHDLGARALVIVPEGLDDAAPVALIRLDLVTVDRAVADEIVKRLAEHGMVPETVTVSATHTHSGPGGYSAQPLSAMIGTDHLDAAARKAIIDAAVKAVAIAKAAAKPAGLDLRRARDRSGDTGEPLIARNRRREDSSDIDDRIVALEAWTAERSMALVNYAVHPIIHRRSSTRFSRDLAGAIEDACSQTWDDVLFVNGASADISPRHMNGIVGDARARELGNRFNASFLQPEESRPQVRVRVRAARVVRHFGSPHFVFSGSDRAPMTEAAEDGVFGGGPLDILADALTLPVNCAIWSSGITEARFAFRFSGAGAAIMNLEMGVTENRHAFGAIVLEIEGGETIPILWAPSEATQALGKEWRRDIADGLLLGYTNGVMGYVTTSDEYAQDSYEARSTLYGPRTGALVTECLKAAYEAALSSDADR